MRTMLRRTAFLLATTVAVTVPTVDAGAHTTSDHVAVPAGSSTTVSLMPTHGCDGSPTVEIRIRAPFEGATAQAVAGWTATTEPDGAGNTILEWSQGTLAADATGKFPVAFTAPDTVGDLLVFPSVQRCENGEELAWISGDPDADFPAPRLLILPADASPAATIDDVPADAPGRDKLAAIVDVDNPTGAPSTTSPATTSPDTTTAAPATTAPATITDGSSDGGSAGVWIGVGVGVVAAAAVLAVVVRRRR